MSGMAQASCGHKLGMVQSSCLLPMTGQFSSSRADGCTIAPGVEMLHAVLLFRPCGCMVQLVIIVRHSCFMPRACSQWPACCWWQVLVTDTLLFAGSAGDAADPGQASSRLSKFGGCHGVGSLHRYVQSHQCSHKQASWSCMLADWQAACRHILQLACTDMPEVEHLGGQLCFLGLRAHTHVPQGSRSFQSPAKPVWGQWRCGQARHPTTNALTWPLFTLTNTHLAVQACASMRAQQPSRCPLSSDLAPPTPPQHPSTAILSPTPSPQQLPQMQLALHTEQTPSLPWNP